MFEVGDKVTMTIHSSLNDRCIPLEATGTVIHIPDPEHDEDYDPDEFDEDEGEPRVIGVAWDEHHDTAYGETYTREIRDSFRDWVEYENVWYVSTSAISLLSKATVQTRNYNNIINRINTLEAKFKTKSLTLRKIPTIKFPDLKATS